MLPALFLAACGSDSPVAPDPDPDPDPEPSLLLLPAIGGEISWAYAVSDNGLTAGMADDNSGSTLAVQWDDAGAPESLLPASATSGVSVGISSDGRVVAGEYSAGDIPSHAFRWTESGGLEDLGAFDGARALTLSISGDGSTIVGGANYPGTPMDAALWSVTGGAQLLGTLGDGNRAFAAAVSFDGSIVVGNSRGQSGVAGDRAFRWTPAGGMAQFPGLPWDGQTRADGLTLDGSRAVGQATMEDGEWRAVLWVGPAEPLLLGTLGSPFLFHQARAITSDGTTIVGRAAFDGNVTGSRAVVWNAEGEITDLNEAWADLIPAGWTLFAAHDISPNGRYIVGEATAGDLKLGFRLDTAGR